VYMGCTADLLVAESFLALTPAGAQVSSDFTRDVFRCLHQLFGPVPCPSRRFLYRKPET
jgi:hypothetical protein